MKEIISRANPLFKQWIKDRSNAGRVGHLVWLEGPHLCRAWLDNRQPVRWLLIDQQKKDDPEIIALRSMVAPDCQIMLAPGLFHTLSEVRSHQGILLLGEHPDRALPEEVTDSAVILDRIQDPGNVGTILRTCAAAGVQTVFSCTGSAACWSPKVLRSAQGAHAGLQIHEVQEMVSWLSAYRRRADRLPIIATTVDQASPLYQASLPREAIWIFGSEGQGVSSALLALADMRVSIVHDTRYVESLNVGCAAALCLFEQRRQHAIAGH